MVLIWSVLNKFNLGIGLLSFFIVVALTGSAGLYLIKSGLLIDVTWAIIASIFTGSTAFYLNYREQYKLRQLIKKQFEHYLDPRQIAILQKDPGKLVLGGEKRYATFIFTDLRNFTAMSEKLKPEQVTYIMNRVLTAQTKALLKHGFMIDKFIGDACMGIGNAPLDLKDHEKIENKLVRFRTLGCYPLTGAIESTAKSVEEIIIELLESKNSEREGRAIDKDQIGSMEKKKQEGYF